jgi:hypothetical protein
VKLEHIFIFCARLLSLDVCEFDGTQICLRCVHLVARQFEEAVVDHVRDDPFKHVDERNDGAVTNATKNMGAVRNWIEAKRFSKAPCRGICTGPAGANLLHDNDAERDKGEGSEARSHVRVTFDKIFAEMHARFSLACDLQCPSERERVL